MHEVLIISPPPGYSIRVYQSLTLLNPIVKNDTDSGMDILLNSNNCTRTAWY